MTGLSRRCPFCPRLGVVAVAVAIAFGLGGRDIAARQLGDWIQAIRPKKS